ncbi:MAG: mercuric reductase [Myxococcota bacterium]
MKSVDHLILGTGQATGTLLGNLPFTETVAVIERGDVGGTCVNTGCTPTKTLVASARVAHLCRRAAEYGVTTGPVGINFPVAMKRMNDLRTGNRDSFTEWIESLSHVTLFRGQGRFVSDHVVEVNGERIEAKHIYINVGTRSRIPKLDGLDEVPWLNHIRILELTEVPTHLVVLGGSYVGLEFGQIFRRFGSDVTVLEAGDRILHREDVEFSQGVRSILEKESIRFVTGARPDRVAKTPQGVAVHLGDQVVEGSHLLVGIGRLPNTEDLGLEHTGIQTDDRGYIVVDDHCQTTVPHVFAVGDVNRKGAFTHTAVNDAEIVLDTMRGGAHRTLSERIPTYALFVDPALGRVGLTEQEAVDAGYHVTVATREMATINRAREMSETDGFVKLIVDDDTDRILGAAILGAGADEIVNMFTAFMVAGRPCKEYRTAMFIHPTIGELMPFILDTLAPTKLSRSA